MTHGPLVVIDMQQAFARSDSPWCTPGFAAAAKNIDRLVRQGRFRPVFTRFVPPTRPSGEAWTRYYERWVFAIDANPSLWLLVEPWADRESVDAPTLSKWGPALAAVAPGRLVLCGVSTDCCVLATAYAAIDAGRLVTVVADACAAEPELHRSSLDLLRKRGPMVKVATTEELLADDDRE